MKHTRCWTYSALRYFFLSSCLVSFNNFEVEIFYPHFQSQMCKARSDQLSFESGCSIFFVIEEFILICLKKLTHVVTFLRFNVLVFCDHRFKQPKLIYALFAGLTPTFCPLSRKTFLRHLLTFYFPWNIPGKFFASFFSQKPNPQHVFFIIKFLMQLQNIFTIGT